MRHDPDTPPEKPYNPWWAHAVSGAALAATFYVASAAKISVLAALGVLFAAQCILWVRVTAVHAYW